MQMKQLSKRLLLTPVIFAIFTSYNAKADVTVPAGTIVTVKTSSVDEDLLFDRSYSNANGGAFKFNNNTSCSNPFGNGSAMGGNAGDALNKACTAAIGLFLDENSDGSVDLGKGDSVITIDDDSIKIGSDQVMKTNSDGSIQIGSDTNDIDLSSEGLSIGGENIIKKSSDGVTSIGKNSLKLQESGGLQKMWATNANGNSIPIDITNGTRLLINGRDVEQSINNIGALSAALSGLPTVPTDSKIACGLGTGTHGGNIAFSGGCASKVNEKIAFNAAASFVPGQEYQGNFEDTFSARAGFLFKFGKENKSNLISMKEKKQLKKEISNLKENNKNILAQNKSLLERLERLEKIALSQTKSNDLATIKLP